MFINHITVKKISLLFLIKRIFLKYEKKITKFFLTSLSELKKKDINNTTINF